MSCSLVDRAACAGVATNPCDCVAPAYLQVCCGWCMCVPPWCLIAVASFRRVVAWLFACDAQHLPSCLGPSWADRQGSPAVDPPQSLSTPANGANVCSVLFEVSQCS